MLGKVNQGAKLGKGAIVESVGGQREGETQSIRQVIAASFIGTTIEWYDFFLYGSAAALVFGQLFFPNIDPLIGTLAAFGTFGVGFVARPIGGIIFGHYGDRIGRKTMLVVSLLMMGIATFVIGLLPTADSIGIWAPVLLVIMRLIQGLGVGGEWGGAVLLAVEHSPENRRGYYGSWAQMGVPAGLLLANAVLLPLASILPEEQFLSWGWRVPFLLSIVLVGVGLFIRLKIMESPTFRQVQETQTEAPMPILDVVRYHPKNVLLAMGMRIAENGNFYIITVFVLDYITKDLGLSKSVGLWGVIIGAAVGLLTIPAYGALSDRLGRRPLYMFGAVFSLLFAFPFFLLLDTKMSILIWLAIGVALWLGHDPMYGPQAAYFSELFGTRLRYSGASIGYQLASVVGGGISPLIAASLLAYAGGEPWLIATYMAVLSLITIVSVYLASETFQEDITAERPEERQAVASAQQ
jgi:MFS transporter, MHS family, shikimate and dehydroshikimate transport protein